jgi:hypothetical protein
VTVTEGVISSIRSTNLNQAALARAHYVADDVGDVAADLAGVTSSLELDDDAVVQALVEGLPAEGGWQLELDT